MRKRTWLASGCLALALLLAIPVSRSASKPFAGLFAVLVLAALAAGVALLPFWRRVPRLPAMPGLFERGDGKWCAACGRHGPEPCQHGAAAGRRRAPVAPDTPPRAFTSRTRR